MKHIGAAQRRVMCSCYGFSESSWSLGVADALVGRSLVSFSPVDEWYCWMQRLTWRLASAENGVRTAACGCGQSIGLRVCSGYPSTLSACAVFG